eukprot:TRINITY_DN42851_c0_g1_i1.p1 TRINITY_DN42851_c0_g1~~TRINITY_DN42851_c0_g1_i1.p1  ORF type:complete len:148 (+),score=19.36 TRINITY_DN42851_c0_g1_i1:163-606(+)
MAKIGFAPDDIIVPVVPVRLGQHRVTEEGRSRMARLKMRAKLSRSMSPERVSDHALLRASELAWKAKRYNMQPSPAWHPPNCLIDESAKEDPYLEASGAPKEKPASFSQRNSFGHLKARVRSLFPSFHRRRVSSDVNVKRKETSHLG